MGYTFEIRKTIQAVACLMHAEGASQMTRMRVCKLLYLADRQSIEEHGAPITGDRMIAMEFGPVLSKVLDLCKNNARPEEQQSLWNAHFAQGEGWDVYLVNDPGCGALTRYEKQTIEDVARRFIEIRTHRLSDWSHGLPEWQQHFPGGKSAGNIPFDSLLKAVGREKDIAAIHKQQTEDAAFASLFGTGGGICV